MARVQAGILSGSTNTETIFSETLRDFLETAGVQNATFNILTPYPGTPLYQRLEMRGKVPRGTGVSTTDAKTSYFSPSI